MKTQFVAAAAAAILLATPALAAVTTPRHPPQAGAAVHPVRADRDMDNRLDRRMDRRIERHAARQADRDRLAGRRVAAGSNACGTMRSAYDPGQKRYIDPVPGVVDNSPCAAPFGVM